MASGLFLSPFFYNAGKAAKAPEPELTAKAKEAKACVAARAYMTHQHMKLLDNWRQDAGARCGALLQGGRGKIYYKSLQVTCMDCHSNKAKFCDQCHNYMGVVPYLLGMPHRAEGE